MYTKLRKVYITNNWFRPLYHQYVYFYGVQSNNVQRYEKLDGFGEDVDMSTLTDQENTTDESDSECDSQEDDVQEDNNDDSDDNSEGSSDCIELLSEDEGEFAKTFKQVFILLYK